ncbi:MAG: GNAT family N-acetyltransferase [Planctomycetes bacterium]|nr:GNAT family N-acetyltransferase [Planctomycetota bacterium]
MIRAAVAADVDAICGLVRELAAYERLEHEVSLTSEAMARHLFGPRPHAEVLIAEEAGQVVGFALFFHNFSTFLARPGIHLEDLYVQPAHRGHGHGTRLLRAVASLAVERGCGRCEWSVLDWNEPAIAFYRTVGAVPMDDWTTFRLAGEPLCAFARGRPLH